LTNEAWWKPIQALEGRLVWVTLAFAGELLCRVDMALDAVDVEDGRLVLVGSYGETATFAVYRQVVLPLPEKEEEIHVATFAGETRVETDDGFYLEVIPLAEDA
jgi:hypothetical protein